MVSNLWPYETHRDTMCPMEQVGVRRLKQETASLLRRVAAGEALEITDHGHPVARLVPILRSSVDQMIAEGRIRPAVGDLKETMRRLGLPRPRDPRRPLLSQVLAEMRADER